MIHTLQHTQNSGRNKPVNPIIFFGTEDFSLSALEALVKEGYSVVAVVTKPDSKQGRGQKLTSPAVKIFAEQHNIEVWQPIKLADIAEKIKAFESPAGVLVSYGKIIPQSIIDLFTPGIINIHPSMLPHYRGPSPVESAILNGDNQTGVSIMQLSAGMDAGPVYAQDTVVLTGNEEIQPLYDILAKKGIQLLITHLPSIISGKLTPNPQDSQLATYCQLIKKADGDIDWQQPATTIERRIRAHQNWPKTRTKLGNIEVIIVKAHVGINNKQQPGYIDVLDDTTSTLSVATGAGSLIIDTVQPIGKKEMPVKAFLAGYKSQITQ